MAPKLELLRGRDRDLIGRLMEIKAVAFWMEEAEAIRARKIYLESRKAQ
jgi:hypothetical protein